jgi:hypothetical protein
MIAAARRRIGAALAGAANWTDKVDRAAARRIERARPRLVRWVSQLKKTAVPMAKGLGKRLRPLAVLALRGFA